MRVWIGAALLMLAGGWMAQAQAPEGAMTQREIDTLRDTAYVPLDRVKAYLRILDDREKELDAVMAKRHGADFANDVHDLMEQMGGIADELNDNLDSYQTQHRDLRKVLPNVVEATEKWSTSLHAPAKDDRYDVIRKVALATLKDTRGLAVDLEGEQAKYFKEHPEAAKAEKDRSVNPHAPQ